MRACRQRPERGKVQLDDLVVHRVGVCGDGNKVRLPTLRLHKRARDLVRRENGGGGAQLGAHIRDGRALGDGERRHAFPAVFDDLPDAALDREAAQQFQNNVLGRDPRREAAGEVDAENARHFDAVRAAAHRHGHVQTAGAEGQHADAAAGRRMAVRPDERFPGDSEALQMHLMADAVARAREAQPVLFGDGLDITVVVGVFKPVLKGVVIYVRHRKLGFHAVNAHRLKLEVGHRARRVLRKRLVDFQRNLAARGHFPADKVRSDDFVCDCHSHRYTVPFRIRNHFHASVRFRAYSGTYGAVSCMVL